MQALLKSRGAKIMSEDLPAKVVSFTIHRSGLYIRLISSTVAAYNRLAIDREKDG